MSPLTPAELDSAERAINANLALQYPGQTPCLQQVCLHPDRTVRWEPDPGLWVTECDYCPAFTVGPGDLMPHVYTI